MIKDAFQLNLEQPRRKKETSRKFPKAAEKIRVYMEGLDEPDSDTSVREVAAARLW